MKIIIEIPDQIYNTLIETGNYGYYRFDAKKAIKKGTPLPKGHGRLIDVNRIVYDNECIWGSDGCCTNQDIINLDKTPTIIEADSGKE